MMSREEVAARAERLRVHILLGGTYTYACMAVEPEIAAALTSEERAAVCGADDQDMALFAAVNQATQFRSQVRWAALEELLNYMEPGELPLAVYNRLPPDERPRLLQLLLASGWWCPSEWAESEE